MAYEIFADSFDSYSFSITSGSSYQTSRWMFNFNVGGSIETHSGSGRRGTASLRMASSYDAYAQANFSLSNYIVVGFWFSTNFAGTGQLYTFELRNLTNSQLSINISSTGKIYTTLAGITYISDNTLSSGGNYIEIGSFIDNSGTLEVRVNGTSSGWLNLSGADTKVLGGSGIDNIRLNMSTQNSSDYVYIDDFWITYGDELKWLGDVCIDALTLTGNDTRQDWVPDTGNAWERLNQSAGNVKSNIIGAESFFELANTTSMYTINSIEGIIINATAKKDSANTRAFAITANSNNVIVTGNTNYLGESYVEYRTPLVLNPNGNTAWTKESINNLKVGIKVIE